MVMKKKKLRDLNMKRKNKNKMNMKKRQEIYGFVYLTRAGVPISGCEMEV